jgi:hypothetical protein
VKLRKLGKSNGIFHSFNVSTDIAEPQIRAEEEDET